MIPGTSTPLNDSLSFVEGDQWGGIPSFAITVNGVPPSSDCASAKMQFKVNEFGEVSQELTSGAAEITISDANAWTFAIPAQTLDLNAGSYYWAFQTTAANGAVQTYLRGTMTVQRSYIT